MYNQYGLNNLSFNDLMLLSQWRDMQRQEANDPESVGVMPIILGNKLRSRGLLNGSLSLLDRPLSTLFGTNNKTQQQKKPAITSKYTPLSIDMNRFIYGAPRPEIDNRWQNGDQMLRATLADLNNMGG